MTLHLFLFVLDQKYRTYYNLLMRGKKESKRREEILNKIPIFLAKTFRIIDVQRPNPEPRICLDHRMD